jgi:uncharacterized membrane protein
MRWLVIVTIVPVVLVGLAVALLYRLDLTSTRRRPRRAPH